MDEKIKRLFYNKNDIIIVLIILAIAALIIYTRIGAIMDYPAKLAKQAAATAKTTTTEPATTEREKISVTIEDSDTASTVAQKIYDGDSYHPRQNSKNTSQAPAKNHLSKPAHTRYQLALCKKRS